MPSNKLFAFRAERGSRVLDANAPVAHARCKHEVDDGLLTEPEAVTLATRLMRTNLYECFDIERDAGGDTGDERQVKLPRGRMLAVATGILLVAAAIEFAWRYQHDPVRVVVREFATAQSIDFFTMKNNLARVKRESAVFNHLITAIGEAEPPPADRPFVQLTEVICASLHHRSCRLTAE